MFNSIDNYYYSANAASAGPSAVLSSSSECRNNFRWPNDNEHGNIPRDANSIVSSSTIFNGLTFNERNNLWNYANNISCYQRLYNENQYHLSSAHNQPPHSDNANNNTNTNDNISNNTSSNSGSNHVTSSNGALPPKPYFHSGL